MKRLKYLLFTFVLCFIFLNEIQAKELMQCEYNQATVLSQDNSRYVKFRVTYNDDETVKTEIVQRYSADYAESKRPHELVAVFENGEVVDTKNGLGDGFTAAEMKKYYEKGICPYIAYTSSKYGVATLKPVESTDTTKIITDATPIAIVSLGTKTKYSPNNQNNDKDVTDGATCVYDGNKNYVNPITVTCKANNSKVECTSSDITIKGSSLNVSNFKKNNVFICPSSIYVTVSDASEITDISLSSGTDILTKDSNASKDDSSGNNPTGGDTPEPPSEQNGYESDERYISAKADAEKYCDSANHPEYQDDAKCAEAQEKMREIKALYGYKEDSTLDLENFCRGPVQGVFTTLGWVIFIVKIVIPILLIVFGTIDVTKAVISSKDDELKKSIKTLVIRSIAGIVIFFVPTILNLVVKLIDNNDVYRGTFWDCTKCMLDPNGHVCSSLGGK